MTAVLAAGAAPHKSVDWHSIDWAKAHRNVSRLQARIVQATKAGRSGKVKALQRLLTHSFSAKALAVKRVTENQGKRTPGVDQIIWNTPLKKATAIGMLRQRGYRSYPLRRIYIPKPHSCICQSKRGSPALCVKVVEERTCYNSRFATRFLLGLHGTLC